MTVALAPPGAKAGLIAAMFVVAYLAFSVPALVAGVAATRFGLRATALVYCVLVTLLVGVAAGALLPRSTNKGPRPTAASRSVAPPASRTPIAR